MTPSPVTTLRTLAGDGVLARDGDLVLLCGATGVEPGVIDRLLEPHRMVADEGGDGAVMADAVAGVARGHDVSLVAFGPVADSLVVTVFGRGWAVVATEHGEQRLAPRNAPPGGLRSTVPGAVRTIRAGIGDVATDEPMQPWTDLRAGVTRAGGLVLVAADQRTSAGGSGVGVGPPGLSSVLVPGIAVDRTEPFSSVLLVGPGSPAAGIPSRPPLPIATRPPEPDAPDEPVPATRRATAPTTSTRWCEREDCVALTTVTRPSSVDRSPGHRVRGPA